MTFDDEQWKDCDYCGLNFIVIYSNDGLGPPEYCPRCGEELEYLDYGCTED